MTQIEIKYKTKKLQALARKFLKNFSCSYCSTNSLSFDALLDLHRFRLESLSPVEQLVKELNCLTDNQADKGYAVQIYSEIQSFEGETQQMIAEALKEYWERIREWEGSSLSDKQRKKVKKVKSILNNP